MSAEPLSLREIGAQIDAAGVKCHFCGAKLRGANVESYPHDGGVAVKGFREKQWVYVKCPGCYDWALHKIRRDIDEALKKAS